MKKIVLIVLTVLSTTLLAQSQVYYVKKTKVGKDSITYTSLKGNPIFTKINIKEDGIDFYAPTGLYTFIEKNKIHKVNFKGGAYKYDINYKDNCKVTLLFKPDKETNKIKLSGFLVTIKEPEQADGKLVTNYKLIVTDKMEDNNP